MPSIRVCTLFLSLILSSAISANAEKWSHHHHHHHHHGHDRYHRHRHPSDPSQESSPSQNSSASASNATTSLATTAVCKNTSAEAGNWALKIVGNTGVSAQQIGVVDEDHILIYDKVQANPLKVNGYPAWGALYTLSTNTVRALALVTNVFCAGGAFLGNGTMASIGGNDQVFNSQFGSKDGRSAVRLFTPCGSGNCQVYEHQHGILVPRWYPTVVRLYDGSLFIIGGNTFGGWINDASQNQPTYEYWPPKNIAGHNRTLITSQFLIDTLNANLFVVAVALPDGTIFMAGNTKAMIYNPMTNTERRLPNLPNGVRISYPMAGSALLLPLTPWNKYTPEILICGGSNVSDAKFSALSSQNPASPQCSRMVLTAQGEAAGWVTETMPYARHMHSMVMLPDGKIVIMNGAQTGVSSYGGIRDPIYQSDADHPAYQPVLYDYTARAGSRFSTAGIPASTIARMYHSSATLTPSMEIFIAGSAPNLNATQGVPYPTEYRSEILSPPYALAARPTLQGVPASIGYNQAFTVTVTAPCTFSRVNVTLNDPGFSTHGQQFNTRLVALSVVSRKVSDTVATLTITSPPSNRIYQPGYGYLVVMTDGIPSKGSRVMVGPGTVPPAGSTSIF